MRARLLAVLAGIALLAGLLPACGGLGGGAGEDGYLIEASFPQAVALFEESAVKSMGITIGRVEEIRIDGDVVRVTMRIDDEVPVPADATAVIAPLTLIGERNVILTPPWEPGMARAEDGHVIAPDRVRVPTEVDDVLETFTEVLDSVDPEQLADLIGRTADAFEGRGDDVNELLGSGARITAMLDRQDEEIVELVEVLRRVSASVNAREGQIRGLIDAYASATGILADERDRIRVLLATLNGLAAEAERFIADVAVDLPPTLAGLGDMALVLSANLQSLLELFAALPVIGDGLLRVYDEEFRALTLSADLGTSFLQLLESLGIPVPCIEEAGTC